MDLGKLQHFAQGVAQAKLDVLCSPNSDLINLDNADCSVKRDAELIRSEISGHEANITAFICSLIRDCICGISVNERDARAAEGLHHGAEAGRARVPKVRARQRVPPPAAGAGHQVPGPAEAHQGAALRGPRRAHEGTHRWRAAVSALGTN